MNLTSKNYGKNRVTLKETRIAFLDTVEFNELTKENFDSIKETFHINVLVRLREISPNNNNLH